jgi:predicted HTH domain antitoxin
MAPAQKLQLDLPPAVSEANARFVLAAGLILQGGGAISVEEAAAMADMEPRDFVRAMRAGGRQMTRAIEDAIDADACREADEEMKRPGGEPLSFQDALAELGVDLNSL